MCRPEILVTLQVTRGTHNYGNDAKRALTDFEHDTYYRISENGIQVTSKQLVLAEK